MKPGFISCLLLLWSLTLIAQTSGGNNCVGAILINDARDYCSTTGQYSTSGSSSSPGGGNVAWFKFVARNFEVKITVSGSGSGGTLQQPEIRLYNDCDVQRIAPSVRDGNTTLLNDAGLTPNRTYYISVSGLGNAAGTFTLCIENYHSQIKPGQDFATASLVCTIEEVIREVNVSGSGSDNVELAGACFDEEKHSAWYEWTAANDGTLVFTLTPTKFDDLDWVLFELGPEGQKQKPSASNIIRCAAGHGINNQDCPNEPIYTQTGLDFNETDLHEGGGCGQGQNGLLKFVTMKAGYAYALIVNNFTEGNNGFELAFTDKSGKAGTGLFKGPQAQLRSSSTNLCTPQQTFTFRSEEVQNYSSIKWYFGEGASIEEAEGEGPFTITYATSGLKTVVLQVKNELGCSIVLTETFDVGVTPAAPAISGNKSRFCVSDTIILTAQTTEEDVGYLWTGPDDFTSTERQPEIPVTGNAVSGTYTLILTRNGCASAPVSITIPPIDNVPVASFNSSPPIPSKLGYPITVRFTNQSQHADAWLWDFGDGNISNERDPEHTYTETGNYSVTLTASRTGVCEVSTTRGEFMISPLNAIFIPNTFTPNNDHVNDEFVISINNVKSYRIQIYNRYGVTLYTSTDAIQNWDGTYKNEPVPAGTYYYVIDAVDFSDNSIRKSGSVTILR